MKDCIFCEDATLRYRDAGGVIGSVPIDREGKAMKMAVGQVEYLRTETGYDDLGYQGIRQWSHDFYHLHEYQLPALLHRIALDQRKGTEPSFPRN